MGKEKLIFEPNPNQLEFAEIYLDYNKKLTLDEIAKVIGITYHAIWKWYQNQDFVDWINSKKESVLNKALMGIYRTAIRKAQAGDFQFTKMILEITGDYVQKSESKVDLPVRGIFEVIHGNNKDNGDIPVADGEQGKD